MFASLFIRTRIYLALLIVVFIIAVASIFEFATIRTVARVFDTYAETAVPRYTTLLEIRAASIQLKDTAENVATAAAYSDEVAATVQDMLAVSGQIEELYSEYRELGADTLAFSTLLAAKEKVMLSVVDYARALRTASPEVSAVDSDNNTEKEATTTKISTEAGGTLKSNEEVQKAHDAVVLEIDSLEKALSGSFEAEAEAKRLSGESVRNKVSASGYTLGALVAGMLILLGALGYVFEKWLFKPLEALRLVSFAIAKGDVQAVAKADTRDELGDLGRAFNLMLTRVRHSQQETEDKAKKLSDALFDLGMLERRTSEERALYELLLTSVGDAVLVVDRNMQITLVNDHASETLRIEKEEILRTQIHELFDLSYREGVDIKDDEFWRSAFASRSPIVLERELVFSRDGRNKVPITMVVSPVPGKDGVARDLVVTFRDVTDLVRLENARVSFISAASHQLRTPLSSMRWFTEMFLDGSLGTLEEKQRSAIESFAESTLHMIGLVNALLQLSRVESKRVSIVPEPTQLQELAHEVIESLSHEVETSQMSVEVVPNPDVPVVSIDRELARQVYTNYVTNALRYGKSGTAVSVVHSIDKNNIRVVVRNEGEDIPEDARTHMFEKFYRASNARKKIPNGNGIGLAFVKAIVEDWGGEVGFSSSGGVTEFWCTIPRAGMKARKGEVNLKV